MTANPPLPPPEPEFGPSPRTKAQMAEIRELEKQYPLPTWEEVMPDWEWYYTQSGTDVLQPYYWQLIAIYNGQVVGSDPEDELGLRIRLSRKYGVHPERFVVSFYG